MVIQNKCIPDGTLYGIALKYIYFLAHTGQIRAYKYLTIAGGLVLAMTPIMRKL